MANITDHPTLNYEKFMHVSRLTPTTVNIISTNGPGGLAIQTINSVMIASHTPPMLAISVESNSPITTALLSNRSFTVNVLGIQHDVIADAFADTVWGEKDVKDMGCGVWRFGEENFTKLYANTSYDKNWINPPNSTYENQTEIVSEKYLNQGNTQQPAPYLADAMAVLPCEIITTMHMGSNIMYLASVHNISYQETQALLYHNSHYCSTAVTVPSYFS